MHRRPPERPRDRSTHRRRAAAPARRPQRHRRSVRLDRAIGAARAAFRRFLDDADRSRRLVVFCDFDADGLSSGALLAQALDRLGFRDVAVATALRDEIPFSDRARRRLRAHRPRRLAALDIGVHREGLLNGVPTIYIDHHQPAGEPPRAVVISAYTWEPTPSTAWLTFELLRPLDVVEDLAWLAAIGVVGDLGDRAPWPELATVKRRYTAKALKEAVSLVNAARRASAFDVGTPLHMLMTVDGPRAIAEDEAAGADRLRAYRDEVRAELARARRRPPIVPPRDRGR